jgi:hypothetical protein
LIPPQAAPAAGSSPRPESTSVGPASADPTEVAPIRPESAGQDSTSPEPTAPESMEIGLGEPRSIGSASIGSMPAGAAASGPTASGPAALTLALAVGLLLATALSFSPSLLNDGDTFMHIRAGEAMIDMRSVLTVDPFSGTRAGAPWQTHEWLAEVVHAAAFRLAGWPGVFLITGWAAGLAAVVMLRDLLRHLEAPFAVAATAIGFLLTAPTLLARPHVLVFPLLVLVAVEGFRAAAAGRRPRLVVLMPAFWLWANSHGSFVVGYLMLAVAGVEALIAAGRAGFVRTAAGWGLAAIGVVAATVAGPHGLATLTFPLGHAANPSLASIGEWLPLDFSRPNGFEIALFAFLLALSRGVRVAPTRMLAVIGLTHLALSHARHQLLLGLLAPVLAAPAFGALKPPAPGFAARRARPATLAVLALLAIAAATARLMLPAGPRDHDATPLAAVAAIPADLKGQPVFNDYSFGAYLIFVGIPPSIDSRAELYGPAFLADYGRAAADRCVLATALKTIGATWTMLAPRNPAAEAMNRLPGWTRFYQDKFAVMHRLTDTAAAEPIPPGCPGAKP